MKKFFKSMALSLVVAVFAICGLAGCGNKDEFKNGEDVATADAVAFISAETTEKAFSSAYNFTFKMEGEGVKTVAEGVINYDGETFETYVNATQDAGKLGKLSVEGWLQDGFIYAKSGEIKVKAAAEDLYNMAANYYMYFGVANLAQECHGMIDEVLSEFEEMIASNIADGAKISVKKLTDEEAGTVRLKVYIDNNGSKGYVILGYKGNQLVEFTAEVPTGAEGEMTAYMSCKLADAETTIELPADAAEYTLVEAEIEE